MRIAVTSLGVVAPGALGVPAFARALAEAPPPPSALVGDERDGRSFAVRTVELPPPSREARRLTRPTLFALAAAREALALLPGGAPAGTGVALGTGYGSIETTRLALEACSHQADHVSPTSFVGSVRHDAASNVARILGLKGPSVAASARRLSFEQALSWALVQLRLGRAPAVLALGSDELTPLLASLLSRGRLRRDVVAFGEGSGALLLESEGARAPLAFVAADVEGAGSPRDQARAIAGACRRDGVPLSFDLLLTDEDGSRQRRADAEALSCELERQGAPAFERRAVASHVGHLTSGGALAAVLGVLTLREKKRVLLATREADGSFFACALLGASS